MKRLVFALCLLAGVHMIFAQTPSGIINVKYADQQNDTTIIHPDPKPEKAPKPEKTPKVKKERKKIQIDKSHPISTGWRGFAEVALSITCVSPTCSHVNSWNNNGYPCVVGPSSHGAHVGFDVLVTYGYQLTHWLYIGAGGGLIGTGDYLHDPTLSHCYDPLKTSYHDYDYTMMMSIPIYGDVRLYATRTKVKPFLDIKLGAMIPLHNRQIAGEKWERGERIDWGEYEEILLYDQATIRYGGLYAQFGLGVEYKNYDFSFNYCIRSVHEKFFMNGEVSRLGKDINPAILTFNLGYNF